MRVRLRRQALQLSRTSAPHNLKYHHFSEVKMPLPAIEEQEQIADTLSTAQQEIDLLKQL
ncbi:MAG: hypothetical protein D3910_15745, partial [Candidatus Electrothrix sp. ATG2]|nr:hypothetical protein [Candidatus Electrothrix sp. ATG2]